MLINDLRSALDLLFEADIPALLTADTGVGKTEEAKAFADYKGLDMVVLHASQMDGSELAGLPYIDKNKKDATTEFAPLGLLPEKKRFILFLDELNRGEGPILQALFQLINERKIGNREYDCYVIGAINPSKNFQVNELCPALLARFCHIGVNTTSKLVGEHLADKYGFDCPYLSYFINGNSATSDVCETVPIVKSSGRQKEWAVKLWKTYESMKNKGQQIDKKIYFEVLCGILPVSEASVMNKYSIPVSLSDIANSGEKAYKKHKYTEEEAVCSIFSIIEFVKNTLKNNQQENIANFIAYILENHNIKDVVYGCVSTIIQNCVKNWAGGGATIDWSGVLSIFSGNKNLSPIIEGNIMEKIYTVFDKKGLNGELLDMFKAVDVDKLLKDSKRNSKNV